jgi:predicted transcriptional regulator of viral defense system
MAGTSGSTHRHRALALLKRQGLVRLKEFQRAGVTPAAVSRLEREGAIVRVTRGLYQLPEAPLSAEHTLAEAAKLVPKGVLCLTSALAFHGLTDQLPPRVWMAIGRKDWKPTRKYPPLRFVRFSEVELARGVQEPLIAGVQVRVFNIPKTLADLFRYRRTVGIQVAIEGLRETLRQRKATPGAIAREAVEAGVWPVMEPYLTALTSGG